MSGQGESFEASASAVGYVYQFRRALLSCVEQLRVGIDWSLAIEAGDDIEVQADQQTGLWQLKHRKPGTRLTDSSTDLWKTLRIWSTALNSGTVHFDTTDLFLLTTADLAEGSAASLLQPTSSGVRNEAKALELLQEARTASTSDTNAKAYKAFDQLNPAQRALLLSRIQVLGKAPDIDQVKDLLRGEVALAVDRGLADAFIQRMEGWFLQRAVQQMRSPAPNPISGAEFDEAFTSLRNQFRPENLPIDLDVASLTGTVDDHADKVFVSQLGLVGVSEARIRIAVRDYLRAYEQRSRWLIENLVQPGEIGRYEQRLVEEWEIKFAIMEDELGPHAVEEEKRLHARRIYRWVEESARFPIRPQCDEAFVTRGSYQMLSDEQRVGWHPDFVSRLIALLEPVTAS